MTPNECLLIVGASARAAAFSALRAGLRPWCADLFADADLRARCPALAVPRAAYPNGFLHVATRQAPPGPWMYTGGIENHRELIRQISQGRRLWGNAPVLLDRLRHPAQLHAVAQAAGLPMPESRGGPDRLPRDGSWLLKPYASCGGAGIEPWHGQDFERGKDYLQQRIDGKPCAAVFVADGRHARLLGVTRQLVGQVWLNARPFAYCGSIGPLPLAPELEAHFQRFGDQLAACIGLQGLFGVDCILNEGVPWVIEVNPRYTASVEVLEHACGFHALQWHREVFEAGCSLPQAQPGRRAGRRAGQPAGRPAGRRAVTASLTGFIGKAILFARHPLTFPGDGPWRVELDAERPVHQLPEFADIPNPGTIIPQGGPILTYFVREASEAACLDRLKQAGTHLDRRLHAQ